MAFLEIKCFWFSCIFCFTFLEEKEKVFITWNAAQKIEITKQNSSGVSQSLTYVLKRINIAICPAKHRFTQMFNGY